MIFFIILLVFLIILELYLRSVTKDNYEYENIKRVPNLELQRSYKVHSETGHSQNSRECKTLGWDLIENSKINVKIKVPYINEEKSINYTLNNISARSNKTEITLNNQKKIIGYFGCSITYGHGLNNDDTYPHKIFESLKNHDFLNCAVPGYSVYQSLLKLEKKIKQVKFDKIILGIHKDLERRNTCSSTWTKIINNFWGIPYMINIFNISLKFKPKKRFELKLFNLRIIDSFSKFINFIFFSLGSLKAVQKSTMKKTLVEFRQLCEKNNIELIVLCLENYPSIYDFLIEKKFNWTSSNINLDEKNINGEHIWQLLPWDNHPNEDANEIYTKKIMEVLVSDLRPYNPKNINKSNINTKDQEYIYPLW